MLIDVTQLLTPTEAARRKGLSLNHLKYLLSSRGGLTPVVVGDRHVFYIRSQVDAWTPITKPKKQRGKE